MRDDAITVGAMAVIAMCVATAAHEAAGHGGACLLLGGRITLLTSVYFRCAVESPLVSPAGPLGNLMAGLAGWSMLRLLPQSWPRTKLFSLFLTAFSFFWAFGYLVYSLARNDGDYAIAFRDLLGVQDTSARAIGIATGVALYLLFSGAFASTARKLFGERATGLLQTAWLAASAAAVGAAALYAPDRRGAMIEAALEIGAASIPLLIPRRNAPRTGTLRPISRSPKWVAAAIAVFGVFALTLGAGYASQAATTSAASACLHGRRGDRACRWHDPLRPAISSPASLAYRDRHCRNNG
jgi:hypothetical protein